MKSTVKDQLNEKTNNNLDYQKFTSFKMLFFHYVPKRFRNKFNKTKLKCCRRTLKYRLLEDGQKQFKADIDVVKFIRDQRWIMEGMNALLNLQSAEFRLNVK